MTSRQIALLKVFKLFSSVLLAAVVINVFLLYFTITQVVIGGSTILLVYLLKVIYDIEYDRAEADRHET